jgi:hypothetical protein
VELRRVTYEDEDGRRWVTRIDARAPDSDAPLGIPVGPPDLSDLGLPAEVQTRLHNQLVDRGLLTAGDIRRAGNQALIAALQAAYKVDAVALATLFSAPAGGS